MTKLNLFPEIPKKMTPKAMIFFLKRNLVSCNGVIEMQQWKRLARHFDYFQITELSVINGKSNECPYCLPTLFARSSGVDVQ